MNWDQIRTILWLRWRLTRNQWARHGGIGAIIAAVVLVAAVVLACLSFTGAFFGGMLGMGEARPTIVLGVWLGLTGLFLFLWLIGLINELQRSELIDLQRLMHLPVALGPLFVINYLVSHLAVSIVLVVPAMLGLALGLAISRGPAMLLLVPLALCMIFMITAWTYCLRGWLAAMMSNPRRRRAVIVGITFTFVLLGQAPNLYLNVFHHNFHPSAQRNSFETRRQFYAQMASYQKMFDQYLLVQQFIPPLWLPAGAQGLVEGNVVPALLGTVGCFAIGALGLRRAYRSTVRFYYGETGGEGAVRVREDRKPIDAGPPAKTGRRLVEWRLPAVPEQAAAIALATLRSMLRAPEVKMAWATSFFVTVIIGASVLFRASSKVPDTAKPFIATGAAVMSVFMLFQFFANQFGFDRDGFRALILSPVERRLILLGKNLACLPVGGAFGVTLLMLISVWLHLPPLTILAVLFQLATMLLLAGLGGNIFSILVPYRIQAGSMKPTKLPGFKMLVIVFCQMFFPIAAIPLFVPPLTELLWQNAGWPGSALVNPALSATLAALAALLYRQTLGPLGRLLHRRESKILGVVTVEVD